MSDTPTYQINAVKKYNDKFDIIQVRFPKGTKERIKALGINQNDFIVDAVLKALQQDAQPVQTACVEKPSDTGRTEAQTDAEPKRIPEIKKPEPIREKKTEAELLAEDAEYIANSKSWEPCKRNLSTARLLQERWRQQ